MEGSGVQRKTGSGTQRWMNVGKRVGEEMMMRTCVRGWYSWVVRALQGWGYLKVKGDGSEVLPPPPSSLWCWCVCNKHPQEIRALGGEQNFSFITLKTSSFKPSIRITNIKYFSVPELLLLGILCS